jgi:hypothetical protein
LKFGKGFLIFDILFEMIDRFLESVSFLRCTGLTNAIFGYISLYNPNLESLHLGGSHLHFNKASPPLTSRPSTTAASPSSPKQTPPTLKKSL